LYTAQISFIPLPQATGYKKVFLPSSVMPLYCYDGKLNALGARLGQTSARGSATVVKLGLYGHNATSRQFKNGRRKHRSEDVVAKVKGSISHLQIERKSPEKNRRRY